MLYIASDHAGFELKEKLKVFLKELGHEIEDLGAFSYDESDDYPDFILPAARAVAADPEGNRGIILGGSGQGEAMAANRIKGVRAAVYYGSSKSGETASDAVEEDLEIIRLNRQHNNANVLSLGARFIFEDDAKKAVKLWLETEFSGEERHLRRIQKIDS